jgi:Domain of unknown function (DUF4232)
MTSPAARRAVATAIFCCTAAITAACASTAGSSASGRQSPTPAASPSSATAAPASTPAASPSPSSPTPAPPSPRSSSTPAITGCASSALKARVVTSQGGAAAGSAYYPIDFTNTSGAACTMFGYPGVSFVTGQGGSRLGRPATRNTAVAPVTVTLPPGGVAHATIQVADAGNYTRSECKPVTGHWLKIYPPNQFAAIYARFTTQVCSAKLPQPVGSQLGVYVVRPGAGKAGQGP